MNDTATPFSTWMRPVSAVPTTATETFRTDRTRPGLADRRGLRARRVDSSLPVGPGRLSPPVMDDRDGQRLDNFLLLQLTGAPRSLVYKLVRSGQVRINGKRCKPDSRLAGGDEVRIPPVKLDAPGEVKAPPKGMLERLAASIVFEDARILAVNKPSGIATHGTTLRPAP